MYGQQALSPRSDPGFLSFWIQDGSIERNQSQASILYEDESVQADATTVRDREHARRRA